MLAAMLPAYVVFENQVYFTLDMFSCFESVSYLEPELFR